MVLEFVIAAIVGAVFLTQYIIDQYQDNPLIVGCGGDLDVDNSPILGVTTRDVTNGATDDKLLASIYANNQWSDWKKLDHSGCDDRERGMTDLYDDFADITAEWEAVALYMCGNDGWAMDSLTYWNGEHSRNEILDFCDNIAGPSKQCYKNEVSEPEAVCYPGYEDRIYEYIFLDQNGDECHGVSIALQTARGRDQFVGKLFFQSNPGVPDCNAITSANSISQKFVGYNYKTDPINSGEYYEFTISPMILYIIIGLMAGLLFVNILRCWYPNICCKRSKRNKYGKVPQVYISSEDDDARHLNV